MLHECLARYVPRDLFERLGVGENPFAGANLQRALAYLDRRGSGRIDVAL